MLRCINCHLCVDRRQRHVVSMIPQEPIRTLLATWRSLQQFPPEAVVCHECFLCLNQNCENGNMNAESKFGHTHICVGCGRSVLNTRRRVRYQTIATDDSLLPILLSWDANNEVISRDVIVCDVCLMRASREQERRPVDLVPEQLLVPRPAETTLYLDPN